MKCLLYTKEFASKKFTGEDMKSAYLKAVKWYASNVLAKDELRSVLVEYEKVRDEQLPTVILHLYASLNEEEVRGAHCEICKEVHNKMFMSEDTNCAWCKLKAYQSRCDNHMDVKRSYCRQTLERSRHA